MIEGADVCVRQVRQQSYESRKVNKSLEKIISAKRALIQRSLGSVDNIWAKGNVGATLSI